MQQFMQDFLNFMEQVADRRSAAFKKGFLAGVVITASILWAVLSQNEVSPVKKIAFLFLGSLLGGFISGTVQRGKVVLEEFNRHPNTYNPMIKDYLLRGKRPEFSLEEESIAQTYIQKNRPLNVSVGQNRYSIHYNDPRINTVLNDRILSRIDHLQKHPEEQISLNRLTH